MNYSINQVCGALEKLSVVGGNKDAAIEKLKDAQANLTAAMAELDDMTVQGRTAIDTLLGCMMCIESIIGKGGEADG